MVEPNYSISSASSLVAQAKARQAARDGATAVGGAPPESDDEDELPDLVDCSESESD